MFSKNLVNKQMYSHLMEQLKSINSDYSNVRRSSEYRIGKMIYTSFKNIKNRNFQELFRIYKNWIRYGKSLKNNGTPRTCKFNIEPNYFCDKRIAVYTVVFGNYDNILEPLCEPDNVDYWLITDQDIDLSNSAWKRYDISSFDHIISKMSNIEKNRYFKMHPMNLFADYKYSLYIDGNVQIITDITEYVYHIGAAGISVHMHRNRDCVYEEADAAVYAKKDTRENISKHIRHLKGNNFPTHYGLLECNVIMREHSLICKQLMEEWWEEFINYSKRDQLSFPYVLFKNSIEVDAVGTMGSNVLNNPSFRVTAHS